MTMTITEGLAEIKTIGKRLEKKRQFVSGYLFRQEMVKDPLEKDGGSVTAIKRERQGISDLEGRIIGIRRAIQKANTETLINLSSVSKSIADWLVWRREVAPGHQEFLSDLRARINQVRQETHKKGLGMVTASEAAQKPDELRADISRRPDDPDPEFARRAVRLHAAERAGELPGRRPVRLDHGGRLEPRAHRRVPAPRGAVPFTDG